MSHYIGGKKRGALGRVIMHIEETRVAMQIFFG